MSFHASDRSYMALIKKDIHRLCVDHGFSENTTAEVDIIVAEMGSNLVKYGGGGEFLVGLPDDESLEIICLDNGPGMHEPQRMIRDGVSSSLSLGHGLGAMQRLSDVFQMYSLKDWGTILLSRIHKREKPPHQKQAILETRALVVCKPGEKVSGDGYWVRQQGDLTWFFLGDGLGHGPEAHKAVMTAIDSLNVTEEKDPVSIIRELNQQVRRTRGLVGCVAVYNAATRGWTICGVGNISTRLHTVIDHKNYMAYNGIIGLNLPGSMHAATIDGEKGQLLTMCSDGIRTRWEMSKYPGIAKCDPSILAAALYKDQGRRTDDMSILVARLNR